MTNREIVLAALRMAESAIRIPFEESGGPITYAFTSREGEEFRVTVTKTSHMRAGWPPKEER